MADGLLASGLSYIDRQKQALAARLGLLMSNPQEFASQLAGEAQQRAGVGLLGEPKTAQEMASGAWINSPYGQQAMEAGSGFAGTVNPKIRSQASIGGETAESNGYFYKGGQFLPSTQAEPGKWKVGKKWVASGKELVEPGVIANQPTPFSRSIFSMINQLLDRAPSGELKFRENVRFGDGSPFSPDMTFRPGVKGVLGKEEISYQEMLDAFNNGQRWFDVSPDIQTITTKVNK